MCVAANFRTSIFKLIVATLRVLQEKGLIFRKCMKYKSIFQKKYVFALDESSWRSLREYEFIFKKRKR